MRSSSPNSPQKSTGSQQLGQILATSLGVSIALHLGAIAGITHFWQPELDPDDPIEITLVKPVKLAVIPPSRSSVVPKIIQPNPTPPITSVKSISKPIFTPTSVKLTPKFIPPSISKLTTSAPISVPKPIVIKSTSRLKQIAIKTTARSPSIAIKPTPRQTPRSNPPFPPEPRTINPAPAPIVIQPSPSPRVIATPKPVRRSVVKPIAHPQPIETSQSDRDLARQGDPLTPPDNLLGRTSGDRQSERVKQPSAGGNIGIIPGDQNALGGGIPSNLSSVLDKNQRSYPHQSGSNGGGNSSSQNGSNGGGNSTGNSSSQNGSNGGGNSTGNSSSQNGSNGGGNSTGNSSSQNGSNGGGNSTGSGTAKLECVKYCEIPKLRDLQDAEGGKDRLRIRIVIDANGSVVDASIAKSSNNLEIDSVILAGIKKMQFSPSGKEVRGIVKANILIRSANPTPIRSIG